MGHLAPILNRLNIRCLTRILGLEAPSQPRRLSYTGDGFYWMEGAYLTSCKYTKKLGKSQYFSEDNIIFGIVLTR
jgi:hypothetical protein